MKPVEFVGQDVVLRPPKGWDNSGDTLKCGGLPIVRVDEQGVPACVSFWRPDPEELKALNEGGHVRLSVVGVTQPPVSVAVVTGLEELP